MVLSRDRLLPFAPPSLTGSAAIVVQVPPSIIAFETIDSTNAEAHRRAAAGARGPLWLRSDRQEAGRGRSGRAWSSPKGNFSATFLFTPAAEARVLHQLAFVAGVAVWDGIAASFKARPALTLKWPNDVLIGDAKVAGILVESSSYGGDNVVMIGIGINVAEAPPVPGRDVTCLASHGSDVTPALLLDHIAAALPRMLDIWQCGIGFAAVREGWLERAHPVGQAIRVHRQSEHVSGTFAGLADDGALLLKDACGEIFRVEYGDVALVPAGQAMKDTK